MERVSVVVVGGGAAGLATAIFAARANPKLTVVVVDGARTVGAKILVSGGSRCNVTNAHVEPADFWRSDSRFVRNVLRALPVAKTIEFFEEIGVPLHEEPNGKLFPNTNKARSVVDALLRELNRLGVSLRTSHRVTGLARVADGGWQVETSQGLLAAQRVVLATGGMSLPKTGSDGFGYALARELGHSIVPPVPALEPLVCEGPTHAELSGVTLEAALRIKTPQETRHIQGSLLFTHFGISGPLALNASRFWRRAALLESSAELSLNFVPHLVTSSESHSLDDILIRAAQKNSGTKVSTLITQLGVPASVAQVITNAAALDAVAPSRLTRDDRRKLRTLLTAWPLRVTGGRGYNFAEVTSGGVSIDRDEIDAGTMESRLAPGVHFVGEILDVDGRIGGFNFQWAWSSAAACGRALGRALGPAALL